MTSDDVSYDVNWAVNDGRKGGRRREGGGQREKDRGRRTEGVEKEEKRRIRRELEVAKEL